LQAESATATFVLYLCALLFLLTVSLGAFFLNWPWLLSALGIMSLVSFGTLSYAKLSLPLVAINGAQVHKGRDREARRKRTFAAALIFLVFAAFLLRGAGI
jgi:hypothetical protein